MQKTKDLIAHALTGWIPMMDEEQFQALKEDVKKYGVRLPVILHDGRIIDGRNRHRACQELGIETPTINWDGNGGDGSVVAFAWSLNGPRRHLSKGALAACAVDMLPAYEAEAAARLASGQKEGGRGHKKTIPNSLGGVSHDGEAVAQAARIVGVNRQYVQDAKKIKEESPELFEQVKAGDVTIPEASRRLADPLKPTSKTASELQIAKRNHRAREKLMNKAAASAAIAEHGLKDVGPEESQKRLIEICVDVKKITERIRDILADKDSIVAAKKREGWTAHQKTRLKSQLSAVSADIGRIEKFI